MPFFRRYAFSLLATFGLASSLFAEADFHWQETAPALPAWMANKVIYEVNVRQYSEAGTFNAVREDLDRLERLGVGVLWFMPIHPIGELNRKGPLGSYYSIKDYKDVNPEFGTKADFRALVKAANERGMHVIIDWVANHSAWDHAATVASPDLYLRNEEGGFLPPTGTDWSDVIQFDVENPALIDFHADAMAYWVTEYGVEGFRCDVASMLPNSFWDGVTDQLFALEPDLFMLAESERGRLQLQSFHASYGWDLMHAFNAIAQGQEDAMHLDAVRAYRSLALPQGGREMLMTSNHDENTWTGTVQERLGGGAKPFAVLSMTMDGIPLIYNGQEAGLDKRLEFFEKDPIDWKSSPWFGFYETLIDLKASHPALAPNQPMIRIASDTNDKVYAFMRTADDEAAVVVVTNLTAQNLTATIGHAALAGEWTDVFTGETITLEATTELSLDSWAYRVLSR